MEQFYTTLSQLQSLEAGSEPTVSMVQKFVEDYQAAIEIDHQKEPDAHIDEVGTVFLEIITATLGDENRLKQSLSRSDVKKLIMELSQKLNCRECPCLRGRVASEGLEPLLDQLIPDF